MVCSYSCWRRVGRAKEVGNNVAVVSGWDVANDARSQGDLLNRVVER